MDKLLNLAEVATVLRSSKQGARRWLTQGLIKSSKIGGDWRVKESDLVAFIEAQVWVPPATPPDTDQSKETTQ
jgi:excisionase family DNA binding protein